MSIIVDMDELKKNYTKKEKLYHNTGNKINLFPFTTSATNKSLEVILEDLNVFKGIIGECIRIHYQYDLPSYFTKQNLIDEVTDKAEAYRDKNFEDILSHILFDRQDNLFIFDINLMKFLNFKKRNKRIEEFALFIHDVFLSRLDKELYDQYFKKDYTDKNNVLYQIVSETLPKLDEIASKNNKRINYYSGIKDITELFVNDIKTMLNEEKMFIEHFDKLLKYYFFYYISKLSFKLNNFFDNDKDTKIFFSLDWEALSQSREAYKYGWKILELKCKNLFSHANCLELLNHINNIQPSTFIYDDIKLFVENISDEEVKNLNNSIDQIDTFYSNIICQETNDSQFWDSFEKDYEAKNINEKNQTQEKVQKLWHKINYWFKNKQKGPYIKYSKWFIDFCKQNYLKSRGRLGLTLIIDRELLLLFTQISIKQSKEEKIRLTVLWKELSKRGLNFDQYSKEAIVKFFERINNIEKKSDSGDAQYIKMIG